MRKIPFVETRSTSVNTAATPVKSAAELPINPAACRFEPAPTDLLMHTVVPMASPTITTVSICMTWLPTATADTVAAPLN